MNIPTRQQIDTLQELTAINGLPIKLWTEYTTVYALYDDGSIIRISLSGNIRLIDDDFRIRHQLEHRLEIA